MPVGINVEDDPHNPGFVLVEFVNPALRGPKLAAVITAGGPDVVEPLTREKGAERVRYRIPEGNATTAGLIDGSSGTEMDDIVQTGPADATGIVLPTVPITHTNIHAPVIRRGTYKDGYGDNVTETQPSQPVNPAIAAPTQAEVATYVHAHEKSLAEREGRDPDNDGALGFTGVQPMVTPTVQGDGSVTSGVSPFGAAAAVTYVAADGTETPSVPDADSFHTLDTTGGESPAGTPLTAAPAAPAAPEQAPAAPQYPEGTPDKQWRRPELNAYALAVKGVDTTDTSVYPSKDEVLELINRPTQ